MAEDAMIAATTSSPSVLTAVTRNVSIFENRRGRVARKSFESDAVRAVTRRHGGGSMKLSDHLV